MADNWAHNYQTRAANKNNLKEFSYRTESLQYSLFPFCVSESNSLEKPVREAKSIKHFKSVLMQFKILGFSHYFHFVFNTWPNRLKLITRLRLYCQLSSLKFRHMFKDCSRHMCNCGTEIETTKHFFLALPIPCQWKT